MEEQLELLKLPKPTKCSYCGSHYKSCCCSGHGKTGVPPWELRGVKVSTGVMKGSSWTKVWPEIDATIDPVQSAASFYLLESIASGVLNQIKGVRLTPRILTPETDAVFFEMFKIKHAAQKTKFKKNRDLLIKKISDKNPIVSLELIMGEAQLSLEELVNHLDNTFVAYSNMAIGGELRYHKAVRGKTLSSSREYAWTGWRKILHKVGPEALVDAATLFEEFEKGGGYGGSPWADCARAVYERMSEQLGPNEKVNKQLFIDRIWTLEHNNGSLLNKINWACVNEWDYGISNISEILDAHAASPPKNNLLYTLASMETRDLADRYLQASNLVRDSLGLDGKLVLKIDPAEIRMICPCCYSNTELGHLLSCGNYNNQYGEPMKFVGAKTNGYDFSNWKNEDQIVTDPYVLDKDFNIQVTNKNTEKYVVNVTYSIKIPNKMWTSSTMTSIHSTLEELYNKKPLPKTKDAGKQYKKSNKDYMLKVEGSIGQVLEYGTESIVWFSNYHETPEAWEPQSYLHLLVEPFGPLKGIVCID